MPCSSSSSVKITEYDSSYVYNIKECGRGGGKTLKRGLKGYEKYYKWMIRDKNTQVHTQMEKGG